MNKDLNTPIINDDVPDLDKAWSEMRKTLDQKLPVKKNRFFLFLYFYRTAAMVLLLLGALLLGSVYYYNDDRQAGNAAQNGKILKTTALINHGKNHKIKTSKDTGIKQLNESFQVSQSTLPAKKIFNDPDSPGSLFKHTKKQKNNEGKYQVSLTMSELEGNGESNSNPLDFESDMYSSKRTEIGFTDDEITEPEMMFTGPDSLLIVKDTSIKSAVATKKDSQNKRLIGIDIGAYYNIGASLSAIYPIASMAIPAGKKTFVSFGVGLNSQVKINNFTAKEFTVLNDTVNQAYFTIEQKNISKATYIDFPVAFNYRMSNKFTVNAGVQLSVLQNTEVRTEKKTFDFQADLSQQIPSSGYLPTSSYIPYQVYSQDYNLPKTNWRIITGIGYQFKNAGIKFQYQQSFTPNYSLTDFNYEKTKKRLSVFTVGMTYRIR